MERAVRPTSSATSWIRRRRSAGASALGVSGAPGAERVTPGILPNLDVRVKVTVGSQRSGRARRTGWVVVPASSRSRVYDAAMDFGLVLPAMGEDASREGIEATAALAEQHGFSDVWGTD